MRLTVLCLLLGLGACANSGAATFDIATATGLFTPTFRGDANTTWVGWDTFDDNGAGDMIINDVTPDVGTNGGSFVTTNDEDHLSGTLNYYSGSGSVSETITFDTPGGTDGSTTVIVQGATLFGGFGTIPAFSDINGVSPTVVDGVNATGAGQFFAKYEIPGALGATESFDISSGPFSFVSMGLFTVDANWSPSGFAPDSAIVTPEPCAALLAILGVAGVAIWRRF